MGFLSELRRRNVLRMAALYVISAWLVMQVVEVVTSLAQLPPWIGLATVGVLAIGFPITLILSWFYELTPEGITLEKDIEPGQSVSHLTGRRLDFVVIALLSAALIVFAWDKWGAPDTVPSEQSIAVLPFDSVGTQTEGSDVLAMGIQDGLLTRLSQIGSFKVISRQSAERYADATASVPVIAAELGVSRVIEGAVQQVGDNIRVNVQLIDAMTDEHIWAASYDDNLTASSVFKIQSDIVEAIAQALDTTLTTQQSDKLTSMPTASLDAYTQYLLGQSSADVESIESLHNAIDHFKAAIELDPNFALAYVGFADAHLTLHTNFLDGLGFEEATALAEPAIMQALTLDGDSGEVYASLGLLRQVQGDVAAAVQAYEQAIELRPSYSRAMGLLSRLRWRQGNTDAAIELVQRALQTDPYSAPAHFLLARIYDESADFDSAMASYLQVVAIEPNHAFAYVYIAAIHFLVHGRIDESFVWYSKAAANDAMSPSLQAAQALAYLEIGDVDGSRVWVERAIALEPNTFWSRWASLLLNLYVGEDEAALADARVMLERYPRDWGANRILRDADITAGRYGVARARYARNFRELTEPEVPNVNASNYAAAVDLALVLQRLGETERADDLLEGSLETMRSLSRFGVSGYWVNDVRALALRPSPELALARLREAIEDGWRLHTWYHMDLDPNLDSIRGTSEFDELHATLVADLEAQARNVRDMRASGELMSPSPP